MNKIIFLLSLFSCFISYSQIEDIEYLNGPPFIGMNACGGIIYEINETLDEVLIVSSKNNPQDSWINAYLECENLIIDNYNDWSLPNSNELLKMYKNIGHGSVKGNIGGFHNENYWSSDISGNLYCKEYINFSIDKGIIQCNSENSIFYSRGVRKSRIEFNKVYGCTDLLALNYDSLANIDDKSCIQIILGCTNHEYIEYDIKANKEDGSCNQINLDLKPKIQKYVENKIKIWQIKGEYEKSANYIKRVNKTTRNIKILEFEKEAVDSLKIEYVKSLNFKNTTLTISDYDADHEVFIISSDTYGDFPIRVPINSAKNFKNNFNNLSFTDFDFLIKNNQFIISDFTVKTDKKIGINVPFKFSLKDRLEYSEIDIEYNFTGIKIGDLNNYLKESALIKSKKKITHGSKVDINIPKRPIVQHRYALIIGNEDYSSFQTGINSEQNVEFAENDASIFKEYALKTLGVSEDNLFYLKNATAGQMKQKIALVTKIIDKIGSNAELIFYYAGHGYPDEITKVPYLIPVDISAQNLSEAINLASLYKTFSELKANRITIFLDACFTGGARNVGLIASRGIKIKPNEAPLDGNIVVFSASSDNQSSLPYYEQEHGIFTYYLLEKIQRSKGRCSYKDLFEYLDLKISINSLKINEKEQNPKLSTSKKIEERWRKWKF